MLLDLLCSEVRIRYYFSWFEATLEWGRVPVSESCGQLMIGSNHEKDLISLLETLRVTNLLIYGLGPGTGL